MTETRAQSPALMQLLDKMVVARQLSAIDAKHLAGQQTGTGAALQSEEDILRWLAHEYGLTYTRLDDVAPERQLASLFPARLPLNAGLLPLRRLHGKAE